MVKEKGDRREMIVSCHCWGGRLSSRDVRYWHKADMAGALHMSAFGDSGHWLVRRTCLLLTQSGHGDCTTSANDPKRTLTFS